MLFDIPDHSELYQALVNRDDRFDGQVFVCVATTGVFCRLTCPARKPKAENCTFQATAGACLAAGFRPCKRCHPLQTAAGADPLVSGLLARLDAQPDFRWTEQHLTALGYDLSTVRRAFKRALGMTFLEMARIQRLRRGFETLAGGGQVIAAQHDAGFDSASAFRDAFARLLGCAPNDLRRDGLLLADWVQTPLGDMVAVSSARQLHLLEFVERKALSRELDRLRNQAKGSLGIGPAAPTEQIRQELDAFFAGRDAVFRTPLAPGGSAFRQSVWDELRRIPAGETRTYAQIAERIGRPTATRAVAQANGANQIAIVIPCHRVLGADGSLTGYGGGLWRKQRLLEIECSYQTKKGKRPHDPG